MAQKLVSQLDQNGYYVGPTYADESPLEPGVWLIPGGAVDMEPPAVIEPGKRYKPVDGVWVAEDIPPPEPEPEYVPTPEELWWQYTVDTNILLGMSDSIVCRHYEDGIPVSQAWKDYRSALRAILETEGIGDYTAPHPVAPPYPEL